MSMIIYGVIFVAMVAGFIFTISKLDSPKNFDD